MNNLVVLQDAKIEAMIKGAKSELERYPYHNKTVFYIEPISTIATDNIVDFMAVKVLFFESKTPNWFIVRRKVSDEGDVFFNLYKHDSKKEVLEIFNQWDNIAKYVDDGHYCQVIQFPKAS